MGFYHQNGWRDQDRKPSAVEEERLIKCGFQDQVEIQVEGLRAVEVKIKSA